jgi:2-(1,2-epoxy-1,2-dihydrophenyl)acetyl-CoA isomerase
MADAETILAEEQDGCLLITLNRPERLNAFNEDMHRKLRRLP